jgi:hypothetical protein
MNIPFLKVAVRVWLTEVLISGFNFFVLMNLLYEPMWGELRAHQIGMSARIVYIFGLAYLLLRYNKTYATRDVFHAGVLWLGLTLAFEWGGSVLILRRPVDGILVGWHVQDGYMWPYVLLAYLLAIPIVGLTLRPGKSPAGVRAGRVPAAR